MAKTDLQIQSFLSENSYRTKDEWLAISSFCKTITEFSVLAEINPENGITASEFLHWYENGFGAGDVAKRGADVVIIGKTNFKAATIVGILADDKIHIRYLQTPTEGLKMASESEIRNCQHIMSRDKQQFCWTTFRIEDKYIPSVNERVVFYGTGTKGLGVVRSVDLITGDVELYCYYIFETKECKFSMHEAGVCNLNDFEFESMEKEDESRATRMNQGYCQRKLNKVLEKYGKKWNQSRHRVEPIRMQVAIGSHYWYLNDKLVLVQDTENGKQTPRERALAGNYFTSIEQGAEMKRRIVEVIERFLAGAESDPIHPEKSKRR